MSLKNENVREEAVGNQAPVAGYEPPRVESVLTPEDVEREALYGGISRA
jgi:hypothetical protein